MAEFQRQNIPVQQNKRQCPRIEFHQPAILLGLNDKAEIIDFSLTGFFVRLESTKNIKEGQQLNIAMLFPHERNCAVIKAKVVRLEKDGFACQFIDLDQPLIDLLERSFEFLRTTLPAE